MHCIGNWLESEASLGKCPMCRQKFQEKVAAPVTNQASSDSPTGRTPARNYSLRTPATGARSG